MSDVFGAAVISEDGLYRYRLSRVWGAGPRMMLGMLNPSTADAELDDPTIRRGIGFAKREGCGSLIVGNLRAYRATDPDELDRWEDFVDTTGPENFQHLREMAQNADIIVAAWGAHRSATPFSIDNFIRAVNTPLVCLGTTKSGAPRHPLYVRADQPLVPWTR